MKADLFLLSFIHSLTVGMELGMDGKESLRIIFTSRQKKRHTKKRESESGWVYGRMGRPCVTEVKTPRDIFLVFV